MSDADNSEALRLNQAIAKTGLCSRRKADELIAAGRVSVNGAVCCNFGMLVDSAHDKLHVDGKPISIRVFTYVVMNKPPGVVTTTADEQDRETVMDLLPPKLRHLKPVGRLDMFSEGLLILTNDGEFTQRLTHPSHHLPKVYLISVRANVTNRDVQLLKTGVPLEDGKTYPARVRVLERDKNYSEVEMTLTEGRNRQIRRMFSYLGYPVQRLVRVAIGGLQLGQIAPGTWRYLTSQEVSELLTKSIEKR